MIIIYCLLGLVAIMEFSTFMVYGGFVSKEITDVYMNLDESKLRLNQFNPSVLATNCFITTVPFSIFSRFHIKGQGTIPRWSKLHKKVKKYFAIAVRNGQ
jgi:pantothenate kinase